MREKKKELPKRPDEKYMGQNCCDLTYEDQLYCNIFVRFGIALR